MIKTKWLKGNDDLTDSFLIRKIVFVDEQKVPAEEEYDLNDKTAEHLVVYDGDSPIGTGRILNVDGEAILGRIAVLKEHRGTGIGDLIVRLLIRKSFESGLITQKLHSQMHAKDFYEKLGFKSFGDEFEEAGILHISMERHGDISGDCDC